MMTFAQAIEVMYAFGDMFAIEDIMTAEEMVQWEQMEKTIFAMYKSSDEYNMTFWEDK